MIERGLHVDLTELSADIDLADWLKTHMGERVKVESPKRQELLAQLPKGFQLAKNLNRHLAQIVKYYSETKRIKVSDDWQDARLARCIACPDKKMVLDDNGVMRCSLKSCGCYLDNPKNRPLLGGKAEYEALTCDNGHWIEIDSEYYNRLRPANKPG